MADLIPKIDGENSYSEKSIANLSDDDLLNIINELSLQALVRCRLLNKRIKTLIDCEKQWTFRCKKDYGIRKFNIWEGWTSKSFYQCFLHKFGYLLGFWQRVPNDSADSDSFSSLLKCEVCHY